MPPILKAAGLYTSPNLYGKVPDGAFTTADNTVIRQADVLEPRRGHWREGPDFAGFADSFAFFGGGYGRVVNTNDAGAYKLYYASLAPTNTLSNYTQYTGTYQPVDTALLRMRYAEAQQNLYFGSITTATGSPGSTKVLTALTNTVPTSAGVPQGYDLFATVTTPALTNPFLPPESRVAYRVAYSVRDVHGNLKIGAPSGRVQATNTSTTDTHGVAVSFYVPLEIINSFPEASYQVYRSVIVPDSVTPDDELFLVYEGIVADDATFGTAGYVLSVQDQRPESLRGAPLYTNPKTGNGILDANYRPPVSKDLAVWQDRMWFANTRQPQRFEARMLGVGTPEGVQNGDRVIFGPFMYWAYTGATPDGNGFFIETTLALGSNVETTARNLTGTMGRTASGYISGSNVTQTITANYASPETDVEVGQIAVEEFGPATTTQFGFAATRPASWNPAPAQAFLLDSLARAVGGLVTVNTTGSHGLSGTFQAVLAGTVAADSNYQIGTKTMTVVGADTLTYFDPTGTAVAATDPSKFAVYALPTDLTLLSSGDTAPNKLFYSKFQEPEAVPLLNYLPVGAKNKAILRIAPLRDRLYVFKEDEGIFVVSGEAPYFRVDLLDNTAELLSPDTVVPLNNQLFALTGQGMVQVSESGVGVVSSPVEEDLLSLFQAQSQDPTNLALTKRYCWAAADERARTLYLGLWYTGTDVETPEKLIYTYNVKNKTWTRWRTSRTFAAVNPVTDDLWLGHPTLANLFVEQGTNTQRDYSDFLGTTITATNSGNVLTVSSGISNVAVGDFLAPKGDSGAAVPLTGVALVTAVVGSSVTYVGTNPMAGAEADTAYVYKAYAVDVEYSPLVSGDPGISKQWPELQFHFWDWHNRTMTTSARTDQSQTATTTTHTTTDYSAATSTYNREPRNFRQVVPLEKQRGTMMRFGFHITEAQSHWRLLGHTPTVLPTSQRTKR